MDFFNNLLGLVGLPPVDKKIGASNRGALFYNFTVWKWSKEKKAAQELIMWLLEKQQPGGIPKAA